MNTITRSVLLILSLGAASSSFAENLPSGTDSASVSSSATNQTKYKKRTRQSIWKEHHFEISFIKEKIARVRYLRNKDNHVIFESHIGGLQNAKKIDKTVNYSVQQLRVFAKKYIKKYEANKASLPRHKALNQIFSAAADGGSNAFIQPKAAAPALSDGGLGLGYSPSVGYLGPESQCYNFTTTLSAPVQTVSLSEVQGTDSYADQYNVSAHIAGKTAAFKAKATATLGGNYASSSYSGQMFFDASVIYNAHNEYVGVKSDYLSSICGTSFVADIPVGMLVMSQFTWSSSTSSASNSISASLSGSGSSGLAKMSAGVSAAYSSSNSNSKSTFGFSYQSLGGNSAATLAVAQSFTNAQPQLDSCLGGNSNDCNTFATSFTGGVATALSNYSGYLESAPFYDVPATNSTPGTTSALSTLAQFPDGVAGVNLPYSLASIPLNQIIGSGGSQDTTDVFSPYQSALNNYLNIINQISTLYNRGQYLMGALSESTFNPTPMWDIKSQIGYVTNSYLNDLISLEANLNTCWNTASSTTATTDCAPLVNALNAGITNAYAWYAPNGPNPNKISTFDQSAAQQNTIAMQYTATYNNVSGGISNTIAEDVFWSNQSPQQWSSPYPSTGPFNPANVPSLVAFADKPWMYANAWYTTGEATFYTPGPGGLITTPMASWKPYSYNINNNNWGYNGQPTSMSLQGQNQNTFGQPAVMEWVSIGQANYPVLTTIFSPINNFFQ